jgi:hypothetical protein
MTFLLNTMGMRSAPAMVEETAEIAPPSAGIGAKVGHTTSAVVVTLKHEQQACIGADPNVKPPMVTVMTPGSTGGPLTARLRVIPVLPKITKGLVPTMFGVMPD